MEIITGLPLITMAMQTAVQYRMATSKAVSKRHCERETARAVNKVLGLDSEKDQEAMLEVIRDFFYSRKKPRKDRDDRDDSGSSSDEDSEASDAEIQSDVGDYDLQDQGEFIIVECN